MGRKILIVVDMQKDFIDGSLGTAEAQAIVPLVKELMEQYPAGDIYATRDTHGTDYLDTMEGRHLPVEHCVKGTAGWQFDAALNRLNDAHIIEKPAFGSYELAEEIGSLVEQGEIEIAMAGLCTDICVVSNALLLKASLPETEITVYADCCAGVTPESHAAALLTMKMCQIHIENFKNDGKTQ